MYDSSSRRNLIAAAFVRVGWLHDVVADERLWCAIDARASPCVFVPSASARSHTHTHTPRESTLDHDDVEVLVDLRGAKVEIVELNSQKTIRIAAPGKPESMYLRADSDAETSEWMRVLAVAAAPDRISAAVTNRDPAARARWASLHSVSVETSIPPALRSMRTIKLFATTRRLLLVGALTSEQELATPAYARPPQRFRVLEFDRTVARPDSLAQIMREHGREYDNAGVLDVVMRMYRAARVPMPLDVLAAFGVLSGIPSPTSSGADSLASPRDGDSVLSLDLLGILGCVRFTRGYFLVAITSRQCIGSVGAHRVYTIRDTEMIPVAVETSGASSSSGGKSMFARLQERLLSSDPGAIAEERYQSLFLHVDLTKDFYYSYSYDVTRPLQQQAEVSIRVVDGESAGAAAAMPASSADPFAPNDMFMWNAYLREEMDALNIPRCWSVVIAHGYFSQVTSSIFGRPLVLTLLARRSRHFAGTRYLKRGVTSTGHVGNEVESEQIADDTLGHISSFVQVRGSVPVYWVQKTNITAPKPPIVLQPRDLTYAPAAEHFADMLARYGAPICVLNLVKKKERTAREKLLGREFSRLVYSLNKSLPSDARIQYLALDYSAIVKNKRLNLLAALRDAGRWIAANVGFFCNTVLPASLRDSRRLAVERRRGMAALAGGPELGLQHVDLYQDWLIVRRVNMMSPSDFARADSDDEAGDEPPKAGKREAVESTPRALKSHVPKTTMLCVPVPASTAASTAVMQLLPIESRSAGMQNRARSADAARQPLRVRFTRNTHYHGCVPARGDVLSGTFAGSNAQLRVADAQNTGSQSSATAKSMIHSARRWSAEGMSALRRQAMAMHTHLPVWNGRAQETLPPNPHAASEKLEPAPGHAARGATPHMQPDDDIIPAYFTALTSSGACPAVDVLDAVGVAAADGPAHKSERPYTWRSRGGHGQHSRSQLRSMGERGDVVGGGRADVEIGEGLPETVGATHLRTGVQVALMRMLPSAARVEPASSPKMANDANDVLQSLDPTVELMDTSPERTWFRAGNEEGQRIGSTHEDRLASETLLSDNGLPHPQKAEKDAGSAFRLGLDAPEPDGSASDAGDSASVESRGLSDIEPALDDVAAAPHAFTQASAAVDTDWLTGGAGVADETRASFGNPFDATVGPAPRASPAALGASAAARRQAPRIPRGSLLSPALARRQQETAAARTTIASDALVSPAPRSNLNFFTSATGTLQDDQSSPATRKQRSTAVTAILRSPQPARDEDATGVQDFSMFAHVRDADAAADAAARGRYVVACNEGQDGFAMNADGTPRMGIAVRLRDYQAVAGHGEYTYVNMLGTAHGWQPVDPAGRLGALTPAALQSAIAGAGSPVADAAATVPPDAAPSSEVLLSPEWMQRTGVRYQSGVARTNCVDCMTEEHQILTNRGFMFLHELEVHLAPQLTAQSSGFWSAGTEPLLIAGYDPASAQIVYERASRLIVHAAREQMLVEVTQHDECAQSTQSVLSFAVTPNHDLYVKRANELHSTGRGLLPTGPRGFSKLPAAAVASGAAGAAVHLLTQAAGGVSPASRSPKLSLRDSPFGFVDDATVAALLRVYGYWAAANASAYAANTSLPAAAVSAIPVTCTGERQWLRAQLGLLGLGEGQGWTYAGEGHDARILITDARWVKIFADAGTNFGTMPDAAVPSWVWQLAAPQARALLDGMAQHAQASRAEHAQAVVRAWSPLQRDDIIRLGLHAGFATQCCRVTDHVGQLLAWDVMCTEATAVAQPCVHVQQHVKRILHSGRTWCVTVPHGFIVVRRAVLDAAGTITNPSTPVIMGNCLDRTNVGQICIGVHMMGLQIYEMGLSDSDTLEPSGSIVQHLMEMYSAMGDNIAMQYGGSEANKKVTTAEHAEGVRAGEQLDEEDAARSPAVTTATGRAGKTGWGFGLFGGGGASVATHASAAGSNAALASSMRVSRLGGNSATELFSSLQRYYANSFTDEMKQAAINVFLGLFRPREFSEPLWELDSDAYLHNREMLDVRAAAARVPPDSAGRARVWAAALQRFRETGLPRVVLRLPQRLAAPPAPPTDAHPLVESSRPSPTHRLQELAMTDNTNGRVLARAVKEMSLGGEGMIEALYHPDRLTLFDELMSKSHATPHEAAKPVPMPAVRPTAASKDMMPIAVATTEVHVLDVTRSSGAATQLLHPASTATSARPPTAPVQNAAVRTLAGVRHVMATAPSRLKAALPEPFKRVGRSVVITAGPSTAASDPLGESLFTDILPPQRAEDAHSIIGDVASNAPAPALAASDEPGAKAALIERVPVDAELSTSNSSKHPLAAATSAAAVKIGNAYTLLPPWLRNNPNVVVSGDGSVRIVSREERAALKARSTARAQDASTSDAAAVASKPSPAAHANETAPDGPMVTPTFDIDEPARGGEGVDAAAGIAEAELGVAVNLPSSPITAPDPFRITASPAQYPQRSDPFAVAVPAGFTEKCISQDIVTAQQYCSLAKAAGLYCPDPFAAAKASTTTTAKGRAQSAGTSEPGASSQDVTGKLAALARVHIAAAPDQVELFKNTVYGITVPGDDLDANAAWQRKVGLTAVLRDGPYAGMPRVARAPTTGPSEAALLATLWQSTEDYGTARDATLAALLGDPLTAPVEPPPYLLFGSAVDDLAIPATSARA